MIDGKDVYSFLSAFTYFIKQALYFMVGAVRRNFLIAGATFLLVAGLGGYYWYKTPALYEAQMSCIFNSLNRRTYGQMVQKLDILAKSKSYVALSAALNLPIEQCKTIVSLEGRNEVGSLLYEDPSEDQSRLYFNVKATDNKVFMPLQKAMLDYMNGNNPYRKKRDTLELQYINQSIATLQKNLALTDSVILAYTAYYKNPTAIQDTAITTRNILSLLAYKKDMENNITQHQLRITTMQYCIELYNGFVPTDAPTRDNKKLLGTTAIAAILLSLFVAMFASIAQNIKNP